MFSNNVGDKKTQKAFTVDDEIRIVLIGKTGVGKSETGNSIIGSDVFESGGFGDSVTQICKMKETIRGDKNIIVVDTPGLFDHNQPIEKTKTEVTKCLGITAPGVHCFLLVVPAGRFSDEDKKTLEQILQMFGENVHSYAIVLFTKVDQLNVKDSTSDENSFQEYLKKIPLKLGEFLLKLDQRCLFINNTADKEKRQDQVSKLFKMIQETVTKNGGKCYTNAMYEKIERKIKEEMERVQVEKENKEREETLQKIKVELLEKHKKESEEKLRRIKKQQEEEGKRQEEKYRRKMKEQEEEYKRKMKEEQQQEKKRQEEEFKRQMKEEQEKQKQSYEEEKKSQEENYRRKLKEELAKERKRQEEEYRKKMEEEQEKEKKRQAEQKNEEEREKQEEENRRKVREDVQKGEMTYLEVIWDWFWSWFKKKEKKSKTSSSNSDSSS